MSNVKCFVVGCSRSGTTLLSVLLDRHSKLAIPPETAFYRDLAAHFKGADRSRAIEILSNWHRLPEIGLDAEKIIDKSGEDLSPGGILGAILSLYAAARDKRYCGEKTPGHFRSLQAILEDFPDAKIMFLMRDGRDAALSLISMPFWTRDLAAAAEFWIHAAKTCRHFLDTYPDRVKLVSYETLATKPEETLTKIMHVLDLPFEPNQLNNDIASGVVWSAQGNGKDGHCSQSIRHASGTGERLHPPRKPHI